MKRIETPKAPRPVGPYSQGIVENGFIFTSGMIPIDPETGKVIPGGVREQTRRVLENVKVVVEEAGSSMEKVTKTTVYLKDASLFRDMNEAYASYFGTHKPARSTIVCGFMLSDILVEIDAIATTWDNNKPNPPQTNNP
jgi:2-iminobutanoate/2-iminopropanoate deaminase